MVSNFLGKHHSEETRKKISLSKKGNSPAWNKGLLGFGSGEKHGNWKGDNVGYPALHIWVKRHLGKPRECVYCWESIKPIQWASVSHGAKRDLEDYISLCISCHANYDDYVNKSWITRRQKYGKTGRETFL